MHGEVVPNQYIIKPPQGQAVFNNKFTYIPKG